VASTWSSPLRTAIIFLVVAAALVCGAAIAFAQTSRSDEQACRRRWQAISVRPDTYYGADAHPGGHGEVWAVGYWRERNFAQHPLIGYWDGTAWHEQRLARTGVLREVVAAGRGEAWAFGRTKGSDVLLRLRPSGATQVALPDQGSSDYWGTDIALTADGALWVDRRSGLHRRADAAWHRVGPWSGGSIMRGPDGGLWSFSVNLNTESVRRLTAAGWEVTPAPRPREKGLSLRDLAVVGNGDAFVAGESNAFTDDEEPLIWRWQKNAWFHWPAPQIANSGVASIAGNADGVWATIHVSGRRRDGPLLRWRNGKWVVVATNTSQPSVARAGDLTVVGRDVWVVDGSVGRYFCR
jgi:hypothetical protein